MKQKLDLSRTCLEALCIFVVFVVHFLFLRSLFYVHGPHLSDVGLQAALLWQNGWVVEYPQAYGIGNYFKTHIVLWFPLINIISYLFPIAMIEWFAMNATIWHLVPVLSLIILFRQFDYKVSTACLLVLTILGFQLSGLVMHIVYFPHFEIALSGLIIICLVQFAASIKRGNKKRWPFWVSFVALISLREDAGFHLAAPLLIIWVLLMFQRRPRNIWLPYLKLGAMGVAASIILFLIQKIVFPGDDALARIYIGDSFMSHINMEILVNRITIWLSERADVTWPYIILCGVAIYIRCPFFCAGILAYIPWMLVSITAINPITGGFSAYYPFPLIVTLMWPLISRCLVIATNGMRDAMSFRNVITIQLLVLAISIIGYCYYKPTEKLLAYRHFLWPNYSYNIHLWRNALEEVKVLKMFEPVLYDSYLMGLLPNDLNSCSRIHPEDKRVINAVVYFEDAWKDVEVSRFLEAQDFPYTHKFTDTKLVLASRIPYKSDFVNDVALSNDLMFHIYEIPGNAKFEFVDGGGTGRKLVRTADLPDGYINWGPHIPLDKGSYLVSYEIVANATSETLIIFDVFSDKMGLVQYANWAPPKLGVPVSHKVVIFFESRHESDVFQFRVGVQGKCHIEIIGMNYERYNPLIIESNNYE